MLGNVEILALTWARAERIDPDEVLAVSDSVLTLIGREASEADDDWLENLHDQIKQADN